MRIRSRIWAWKMKRRRRRIVKNMPADISSYIRQYDAGQPVKGLDAALALLDERRGPHPEDTSTTERAEES
jgi:hypothetical protein